MSPQDEVAAASGIPQSTALAEAKVDSLSELLSRDPEGYQDQDLDAIILAFREQRVRWQASEAAGGKPRAAKAGVALTTTMAKAEDLGL